MILNEFDLIEFRMIKNKIIARHRGSKFFLKDNKNGMNMLSKPFQALSVVSINNVCRIHFKLFQMGEKLLSSLKFQNAFKRLFLSQKTTTTCYYSTAISQTQIETC